MLSTALLNRMSFGFSAEKPMGKRNGGSRGKDCEKLSLVSRFSRRKKWCCVTRTALEC